MRNLHQYPIQIQEVIDTLIWLRHQEGERIEKSESIGDVTVQILDKAIEIVREKL